MIATLNTLPTGESKVLARFLASWYVSKDTNGVYIGWRCILIYSFGKGVWEGWAKMTYMVNM